MPELSVCSYLIPCRYQQVGNRPLDLEEGTDLAKQAHSGSGVAPPLIDRRLPMTIRLSGDRSTDATDATDIIQDGRIGVSNTHHEQQSSGPTIHRQEPAALTIKELGDVYPVAMTESVVRFAQI
jgi:hypothetical protein